MLRKLLKGLGVLAGLVLLYVVGILLYGTLTDWQPTGTNPVGVQQSAALPEVPDSSTVSFLTWNVGYGGIGDEDFFFYNRPGGFWWAEPGTVRMSEERVEANVAGQDLTVRNNLVDFVLLQEVDTAARRSHYTNQLAVARAAKPDYAVSFAANFKSKRVPIPLLQPWDHYGAVVGGLVSLARYQPTVAERIQLPGEYGWPTKLFQLDRCALRQVVPVAGGRELAVYNVHLSAYDTGGTIRRQQMEEIRRLALADYEAGRYVVVGGDWNQLPPGFNYFTLNPTVERIRKPITVAFDFMPPGWKYAYDPAVASVRNSADPYSSHTSRVQVIDFFLLSPNLRITAVKGINQSFKFSDHQPVYLEVALN